MNQTELLEITETWRVELLRLKRHKLDRKKAQYAPFDVNLSILFRGFLEELGEFLSIAFSKTSNPFVKRNELIGELIDLSNQLDFLFAMIKYMEGSGSERIQSRLKPK